MFLWSMGYPRFISDCKVITGLGLPCRRLTTYSRRNYWSGNSLSRFQQSTNAPKNTFGHRGWNKEGCSLVWSGSKVRLTGPVDVDAVPLTCLDANDGITNIESVHKWGFKDLEKLYRGKCTLSFVVVML